MASPDRLACLGELLPERWWRAADKPCPCGADHLPIEHEAGAHGSPTLAARAHGIKANTVHKAWGDFGLPRQQPGNAAAQHDERPVDDEGRLRERSLEEQNAYLRRRNQELDKALTNRQAIIEKVIEAARMPVKMPTYKLPPKRTKSLPRRSAILPVFDCQFGQLVQPSDVPLGAGAFNAAIFDERLQRWIDAVVTSMRDYAASHEIVELVVPLGGDLVEGEDIFKGQAWQLEYDPARQTVEFARRFTTVLRRVVTFVKTELGVKRIMVVAVPGNHGKVGGKMKGAAPSTMSWDWLAAEWIKDSLRGEPIDVWGIEPGGMALFETMEHLFLTIHGDEVKGWGGIPFYGFTRYDGRAQRLTGVQYDYLLCGHHHQPASIPLGSGGEIIVSGDWVGPNNLSRQIVAGSRPQQNLLFVAEKYGVTERVPLYLTETSRRPKPHIYSTDG